ncbi:MAG: Beta-glucoside kinase [Firmicutes bacterium ADurb.Bin467]|nr:MAG: Beta-glucoside kinase [Firmicutes bacterium ADurb.Bin467]
MMVGKPEILGEMNKKLILDHLRKCGPQSRADLSRNLGMSFPTVSTNVEALLENELIAVIDAPDAADFAAGRRPILFGYNADWGYVVSMDMGRSRIRMMVLNVAGDVVKTVGFKLKSSNGLDMLEEIDRAFLSLLSDASVPLEKVRFVSIGMPGILDPNTNRLELAPFLNEALRANRIDQHLERKYGLRTTTENSVNLAAIAEKWQGAGVEYSDIVYVDLAVGIGSALILGGELVTGHNGAAGEIGYMLPGIAFRRKVYDEEGVLEKILSASEIERRMVMQSQHPGANTRDLFEGEGAQFWEPYLEDIRSYLAMTLVNLVAVLNPELVIVGGGLGKALLRHDRAYFTEFLRAHVPYVPKLVEPLLDENAALLGAAAYALRLIHDEQTLTR